MVRFFKEICLTAFVIFYRIPGGKASGKTWGAVTIILLVEFFILMDVGLWIEIFTGTRVLTSTILSKLLIFILVFALYSPNYYILVNRGYGVTFERNFNNLIKSRRILLVTSCVVLLLVTAVFYFYSLHVYQHFFHIVRDSGP